MADSREAADYDLGVNYGGPFHSYDPPEEGCEDGQDEPGPPEGWECVEGGLEDGQDGDIGVAWEDGEYEQDEYDDAFADECEEYDDYEGYEDDGRYDDGDEFAW